MAQGFYEWLKKNGGKEKIPHFVSRKDGQLMCFAGLWDVVQYEGKSYTVSLFPFNPQFHYWSWGSLKSMSECTMNIGPQ